MFEQLNDFSAARGTPYTLIRDQAPEMQRMHAIDIFLWGHSLRKHMLVGCHDLLHDNAGHLRIAIELGQGLQDSVLLSRQWKIMHMVGNPGIAACLFLQCLHAVAEW
jgi:hypothetical protein